MSHEILIGREIYTGDEESSPPCFGNQMHNEARTGNVFGERDERLAKQILAIKPFTRSNSLCLSLYLSFPLSVTLRVLYTNYVNLRINPLPLCVPLIIV